MNIRQATSNQRRSPSVSVHSLAVLLILLWGFALINTAAAQSEPVTWDPPIKLSTTEGGSTYPAIAADSWGGLHVFWVQSEDQEAVGKDPMTAGNVIYYRAWDGDSWTTPVDLFFSTDGSTYTYPFAVVDAQGTLHLIWSGTDGLYYSSAPANEASNAKAWKKAERIVQTSLMDQTWMVSDKSGGLHIIYTRRSPGDNVYYISSQDGGATWSAAIPISDLTTDDEQIVLRVRLALDSTDRLHAVWSKAGPPDWRGYQVFYAQSDNGGQDWSAPVKLSDGEDLTMWNAAPLIASDSEDVLHVVWACGTSPHRCYKSSKDGGQTWSGTQQIFGDLLSLAGWDAMAVDGYGNAWLIAQLRYPEAVYSSRLTNGRWSDPPQAVITEGALVGAHWPQMVVNEGNHLNVVLQDLANGGIWYMRGVTGFPHSEPMAPPSPTPIPTDSPGTSTRATTEGSAAHVTTPTQMPVGLQATGPMRQQLNTPVLILMSIVPAILLVGAVMITQLAPRRRR